MVFYFSGHGRCANGSNYLVPSGGPVDNLDAADKFATRALRVREDVIKPLQVAAGTLSMVILDCFRASQSIAAPAGCGLWRQGKGDWERRIPRCFLHHIRPRGLASTNLMDPPANPSSRVREDVTHGNRKLSRTESNDSSLDGRLLVYQVLSHKCMR